MGKNPFFWIIIVFTFSSCSSTLWIQGTWNGTGYQDDGQIWEVLLHANNPDTIKIEYPDLACGGNWKITSDSTHQMRFIENIVFGVENCDQGTEITVNKISKTEIEVLYYIRWIEKDKPIANAILKKLK